MFLNCELFVSGGDEGRDGDAGAGEPGGDNGKGG